MPRNSKKIEQLLAAARNDEHEIALERYAELTDAERLDRAVMFAVAGALYELGRDLEALHAYRRFVEIYPSEAATPFALFGVAITLKNLGLHSEALEVLAWVPPAHEGLEEEVLHAEQRHDIQAEAKKECQTLLDFMQLRSSSE